MFSYSLRGVAPDSSANATEERRLAGRLHFACLPDPWTLSDFDFATQSGVDEKLLRDLATLRLLDDIGSHRN